MTPRGRAGSEIASDPAASAERRRVARTVAYHAQNLRVLPIYRSTLRLAASYAGNGLADRSGVGAELVDVSDTGLGLKVFAPLIIGSDVAINVELHSTVSCVELKVVGRVVHCRCYDELYRVGLSIQGIERLPLQCCHEGAYTPDLDS